MKFELAKNKLAVILIGGSFMASIFLWLAPPGMAYDDQTMHPDLTREIIAFYELSTGKKLTDEQKQWAIQGSRDEALVLQKLIYPSYLGLIS